MGLTVSPIFTSTSYTHSLTFPTAYGLTGLSRGGQQVSKCKEMFGKAVKLMVDLATMQARTQHSSRPPCVMHNHYHSLICSISRHLSYSWTK